MGIGYSSISFLNSRSPSFALAATPNSSTDARHGPSTQWSKEDQAFLVEVSELPSCIAAGTTYEEEVANSQSLIGEWIETAKALDRLIFSDH